MDFLSLARTRFSVRKFKPVPVTDEDLLYVLEAGRIAPSAVNYQPWKFLVVRDKNKLATLHTLYHRAWFREAPVVIVILADHEQSWKRSEGKDHADIDAAIAADHMTLAATDVGLGTCWVCNFDKEKTIEALKLPANLEPVIFLPLGHPDQIADPHRHKSLRKSLDDITEWL